jgi:O-succinylbenzoic acid--CoA ligase
MNTNKININGKAYGVDEIIHNINNLSLSEWEANIYQFIVNWFNSDDFILQKTSGSTGEPKEIKLKKSAMIASAKATLGYFHLTKGDNAWLCLPVDYIAGKMMVVRAIVGCLNLIVSEPVGVPQIPDYNIDFTAMVPLQLKKLIDADADLTPIKKIIVGGAAIDYPLQQALKVLTTEVFATYGMTETCSHIALQRINGPIPDRCFETLTGITVETNESGCLTIFAPELSVEPILTTDMAEIISPKKFRWLGRADNVINSGGIKISPEELETAIRPLINANCIISSRKDEMLGNRVILVIEGAFGSFDHEGLIQKVIDITGKYKAPKEVVFIDKFPLNASMKIDRKKIETIINISK